MATETLIGTLQADGTLETATGTVRLKGLQPAAEQSGRLVTVRGRRRGDLLEGAEIVETAPPMLDGLVKALIRQQTLSLQTLQAALPQPPEAPVTTRLCALVIGHKQRSPGAVNEHAGLTEFAFNEELARRIEAQVGGVEIQRVYRRTYRELPADINALGPDFAVSLHCNAFNGQASGTEVLYYHRSQRSKAMAEILQRRLVDCLGLPDRGIRPRSAEDRGGFLLRYTDAPCVISEPFFIDNDADLARAQEDPDALAAACARAIEEIAGAI